MRARRARSRRLRLNKETEDGPIRTFWGDEEAFRKEESRAEAPCQIIARRPSRS